MDLGLAGARALVFGSSSGLGRAVAATLAAEGASVAVVSRDSERAASAAAAISAAAALTGDLTTAGDGARVVAEAATALGGLDICVVNTGGGRPGGILATSVEDDAAAYAAMLRPVLEVAAPLRRTSRPVGGGGSCSSRPGRSSRRLPTSRCRR